MGHMNGHASQCQRTPVPSPAEQTLSVLPFTEYVMCFCKAQKRFQSIASFPPWPCSSPIEGGHYSLMLSFRSTPFPFGASTGHRGNWHQAVPAQLLLFPAFTLGKLLQQHRCCSSLQLVSLCPGCSSALSHWCPQHTPSTALTRTAVMGAVICTSTGDRWRETEM